MDNPIIEFKNVVKRFGDKTVLDGVSFTLNEGEITTIIGKSGTGKSVMLKHLIGLMEPDSGSLYYKGKDIVSLRGDQRRKYLGKMSYMFQGNALFDSMTVFENVAFPLEQTSGLTKAEIKKPGDGQT